MCECKCGGKIVLLIRSREGKDLLGCERCMTKYRDAGGKIVPEGDPDLPDRNETVRLEILVDPQKLSKLRKLMNVPPYFVGDINEWNGLIAFWYRIPLDQLVQCIQKIRGKVQWRIESSD